MTRIIGVVNLKGGVGKTTTTVNLGSVLRLLGFKVLLVDIDPQRSLTGWAGINSSPTIEDILLNSTEPEQAAVDWGKTGCRVLPAGQKLQLCEARLTSLENPEYTLRNKLGKLNEYDFILIDSSPSYSLLTINAICAAEEIIIPLQTEILSLESTIPFFEILGEIKQRYHPQLEITGILPTMFDARTNLSKSILDQMRASVHLGPLMFKTVIRKNVKLAETPSLGCAITRYTTSFGNEDYSKLADEILTDSDREKIYDRQKIYQSRFEPLIEFDVEEIKPEDVESISNENEEFTVAETESELVEMAENNDDC